MRHEARDTLYTRPNYFGGANNCVATPCGRAAFSLFPRGFGPLSPSGIAKTAENTTLWASGTCKVPCFLDRTATRAGVGCPGGLQEAPGAAGGRPEAAGGRDFDPDGKTLGF